ncbi:hypothetical protein BS47DRAFT_1488532 [Hydnum rufescens UP504]|uniref:Uncharacterized protein n=1 Tax=Hydnum rufescens UP504 TaxID=1448309 RepID=A0A9P6ALU7_9AGAM|nr:hypothetical protein BS47DRAFT_1488532 [Hydnum rufescens UP504]
MSFRIRSASTAISLSRTVGPWGARVCAESRSAAKTPNLTGLNTATRYLVLRRRRVLYLRLAGAPIEYPDDKRRPPSGSATRLDFVQANKAFPRKSYCNWLIDQIYQSNCTAALETSSARMQSNASGLPPPPPTFPNMETLLIVGSSVIRWATSACVESSNPYRNFGPHWVGA